jgi:hypothetical protein
MRSFLFVLSSIVIISLTVSTYAESSDVHFHGGIDPSGIQVHRGDTIDFTGWANVYQDWKAGYTEIPNSVFDINIVDSHDKSVFKKTITGDQKSNIRFSLPISNDFEFGKYLIKFSISKEGYETYSEDQRYFNVVRSIDDYVTARNYEFKLWPESTEIKYQSYPILHFSICPSPIKVSGSEAFIDPETDVSVDASHGLVTYYLTRPDGAKTNLDQYSRILYNWFDSATCPNTASELGFYANMGGNWTAYAVAKWITNGTLYKMQSNTVSLHVMEPRFPSTITKIINMTNISQGLDISQDEKFIIFTTDQNDQNGNYLQQLWTAHPDGNGIQQIDVGKKIQQFISPKISPSGNLILWSGAYYDSNALVYGLFVYDLRENKLVQISRGGTNPDTVGEFHWTQDDKIAYTAKKWDNTSHNLSTSLVIADSKGNTVKTMASDQLSLIDLYKDPDRLDQMTVSVQGYQYSGGGAVSIKSTDGLEEKIFEKPNGGDFPVGAAISSDGKTIVFGYFQDGIYVAKVDKSVTEYASTLSTMPAKKLSAVISEQKQSSITFENPVNLSNDEKSQNPKIVASGNNVYVVWEDYESGNSDIYFKKSSDGGATFGNVINLSNNDGRSYDPQLVVSGNNVYVVWSDETRGHPISTIANTNIMFVKSADGGLTFSVPKNLSIKNVYSADTVNESPKIAISSNNVYVIWVVSNYSWMNVFLATSTDNGNAFGEPINVSNNDKTDIVQLPGIAASDKGVFIIWQNYFNNSHDSSYGYIKFAKSTDGKNFSVQKLSDNDGAEGRSSTEPHVYANGNNVYALWRDEVQENGITFAQSSDGGNTFSKKYLGYSGLLASDRTWVVRPDGNHYVIWTDGKDIFFIKSTDGGLTFSTPMNLSNNTWNLNPYDEIPAPQLAVLGNNVFVTWKYTILPDGNHSPFFVASTDGGDSFSEPVRLSQSSGDSREIPQITTSGSRVYVVYSDTIPTGSDVFFVKGTSSQIIPEESKKTTEINPSGNLFEQLSNWIKQIFHL